MKNMSRSLCSKGYILNFAWGRNFIVILALFQLASSWAERQLLAIHWLRTFSHKNDFAPMHRMRNILEILKNPQNDLGMVL